MTNNYLTPGDVLGIHQDSIKALGGSHGIRDRGGLEAAVMRPQIGYYIDGISEAAAFWEPLSQTIPLSMVTSAPQLLRWRRILALTAFGCSLNSWQHIAYSPQSVNSLVAPDTI